MKLSAPRLLNLIYFLMVQQMDADQRRAFDQRLEALARPAIEVATTLAGNVKRKPSWWRGDDEATSSSIEAARQLGLAVGPVT